MKMKKILALGLSMAMVLGVVAACDSSNDTTTTTTAAPASETTAAPAGNDDTEETTAAPEVQVDEEGGLVGYTDLGAAEVANEGDKLEIWSFNTEVGELAGQYSAVQFDYQEVGGGNQEAYRQALDQALASGDQAPDLFACDADYAQLYLNSDNTMPINSVGVDYKDLTNMYNYTLQFATDDENVIKGLAWQACPCGIYYNRSLAAEYLGVSEPEDVAPYFATWDAFLQTAKDVNEKSGGAVKAVSGTDDIWRAYLGTRTQGWIKDGEIVIDPVMSQYFDVVKTLYDEDLTFKTSQWTDPWTNNAANSSTLTFWGPMWLGRYSLNFANEEANPTAGDWGMVNAPGSFFWGGTWLMASKDCDMKADAGQVMYDLCISEDNLKAMAAGGEFVNSVPVMTEVANDPSFAIDWLGGQNPAGVLLASASTIDNSTVGPNDGTINDLFQQAVGSYLSGDIATVADAEASFEANVKDVGII